MLPRFRWTTAAVDAARTDRLTAQFSLARPVAALLGGRGHDDPQAVERFLDPRLQYLGDPLAFPGMEPAARRIWQAIGAQEPMVVFGDFDADGVTATALLTDVLRQLGGQVAPFLPDRVSEGYGLTAAALARCLREHPVRLLITVDCGINSVAEVAQARAQGVEVLLTDHHEPGPELPAAHAVVNPRLGATPGAEYLCGAGVAFKLAHALLKLGRLSGHAAATSFDLRTWLDAVAVATVADVVPLLGENRILVSAGIAALARRPRMGLKALAHRAGVQGVLTSHHLAFTFGPRLNAAGRMRTGWPALRLLHAVEWDEAMQLAVELEGLNAERRSVESRVLAEVTAQLRQVSPRGAVVAAGTGWHVGTLGIVAARLAEAWNLPAAVIALAPDGSGRGSVRGGRGDNVVAALNACAPWLSGFGGHPRAAGLQLKAGALPEFQQQFPLACARQRDAADPRPELSVDGWLTPDEINDDLWDSMQRLEPFGEGHARPRWGLRGVRLAARPAVVGGNGEHMRLECLAGQRRIRGVWFKMGRLAEAVAALGTGELDAVFELHRNHYHGQDTLEMQVQDLRPAAGA